MSSQFQLEAALNKTGDNSLVRTKIGSNSQAEEDATEEVEAEEPGKIWLVTSSTWLNNLFTPKEKMTKKK